MQNREELQQWEVSPVAQWYARPLLVDETGDEQASIHQEEHRL